MKSSTQRWDQGLYLVSTPIGNLADMTFRAVEALRVVDMIFCEDTRVTKKLCQYYDIKTPLKPYHDHSDDAKRQNIIDLLKDGQKIALVSDAGTPMISDPGYKLVLSCVQNGLKVIPLPGANAVLPAIQLSGFPTNAFFFGGFLPSKTQERTSVLQEHIARYKETTLCYYESPKRLKATLKDIKNISDDINVSVSRELTKLHEEALHGAAGDVLNKLEQRDSIKGEIVLCLHAPHDNNISGKDHSSLVLIVQNLLKTMSLKDVSAHLSLMTSMSKKDIYALGLSIKDHENET
jgi:16S rRNA (cytidine1402-2'-O)-methyltransferase